MTFYDGYYSNGGSVTAQSESKEKYTNQIRVTAKTKINVSEYHANRHSLWIAVCEWFNDGTFSRTVVASNVIAISYAFTYVPTNQNVKCVAFTFRGYDDYTFAVTSAVDDITLADELLSYIEGLSNKPIYNFSEHIIKGINHRGYNTVAPENTLPAYRLSVVNGFKFLETDVRFTSDNVPVLLHDATVDRTSNGTGNIADMTYAQARELDFGSWKSADYAGTKIPSFEEFIVFCRNVKAFPYCEVSFTSFTETQAEILHNIVRKYGMENSITWISYYKSNLSKIIKRNQKARVGLIPDGILTEAIAADADSLKTGRNEVFIDVGMTYIANAIPICTAHELGLETWTINSADTMLNLNTYVSGVTSDSVNFEAVIYTNETQ
jgi:glycerophosphoryl diester phosphodiesterase